MKRYISTGLSLPTELMQKIDSERGDLYWIIIANRINAEN